MYSTARLTRGDFLALCEMDAERYKSLKRRDLLPFADREDGSEPTGEHRRFKPIESLLMVFADLIAGTAAVSQSMAATIASRIRLDLAGQWPAIAAAAERDAPIGDDDVLGGAAFLLIAGSHPTAFEIVPVVAFRRDLGTKFAAIRGTVSAVVLGDVTRAARLVRFRAAEHGIDLGDFWLDPSRSN